MKYRLVHQQAELGPMLVDDIEDGLPREELGVYFKQDVYIPYYFQSFGNGEVVVDETRNGFVDLVPSDKVELSRDRGTIKGLEDAGLISVVEFTESDLDAPSISTAEFDSAASTTDAFEADFQIVDETTNTGDYEITLNGSTFTETDSTGGADDSTTIATNLAATIDADPDFDASAVGDTITVSTSDLSQTFTHSTNVTDTGGAINTTVASTGRVVITGTNFLSLSPDVSSVTIRDDSSGEEVELIESDVLGDSGVFNDTTIVVRGTTHGLGSATGDVESVDVTADTQTDSSAVSEV